MEVCLSEYHFAAFYQYTADVLLLFALNTFNSLYKIQPYNQRFHRHTGRYQQLIITSCLFAYHSLDQETTISTQTLLERHGLKTLNHSSFIIQGQRQLSMIEVTGLGQAYNAPCWLVCPGEGVTKCPPSRDKQYEVAQVIGLNCQPKRLQGTFLTMSPPHAIDLHKFSPYVLFRSELRAVPIHLSFWDLMLDL